MADLMWEDVFSNNSISLLVDKNTMKLMLNEVGNELDADEDIIDSITKKKVISQDGGNIKLRELGTISSGSKNFIRKNIASYSEFLSQKRK